MHQFGELQLCLVSSKNSRLWNEYIQRYHYLGYTPLPGAQLRYFVIMNGQVLALLGFGASAWQVAPRDSFIGWDHEQRRRGLPLIVNNARFLNFTLGTVKKPSIKNSCHDSSSTAY